MKLSDYAERLGISYRTAWNHYKKGYIPGAYQLPSKTIIVPDDSVGGDTMAVRSYPTFIAVYCHVEIVNDGEGNDDVATITRDLTKAIASAVKSYYETRRGLRSM